MWASLLARTFASPCFGREPMVKVATIMTLPEIFLSDCYDKIHFILLQNMISIFEKKKSYIYNIH